MGITGTVPARRKRLSFGSSLNRFADECLLSGVKRTCRLHCEMAACDQKRTLVSVVAILGIIDDCDVSQAVRVAKLETSGCESRHNFDRDIERGEEIQEGKARCPGAKEEGDEDGEAG